MTDSMSASAWSLPWRITNFIGWFIGQFIITSLKVLGLILSLRKKPEPGIVRMRIADLSEAEVTILVILITITPDTLVIAVDREHGSMFVHGMFVAKDPERFRKSLRQTHDRLLFGTRLRPSLNLRNGFVK
jgi:multicomponent Na+:H+ antiporter subunit E